MERKPNRAKSERDTVNIGLEYWDVVRSDVGSRHTVDDREFRFLAILEGIREVSHGMGDLISVGQSGLILGIRYADKIDDRCHRSWVYCPLCPSTVQALAKAGKITKLGWNRYRKKSVVDHAELTALRKNLSFG